MLLAIAAVDLIPDSWRIALLDVACDQRRDCSLVRQPSLGGQCMEGMWPRESCLSGRRYAWEHRTASVANTSSRARRS